jgi:hypothetical protein
VFNLPEKITVWNQVSNDGVGNITWSDPDVYDARTALKQEKFTDKNGDQQISTAVAYSDGVNLKINSQVFFGESVELEPIAAANDVRALSQIPSGVGDLKKVWFK